MQNYYSLTVEETVSSLLSDARSGLNEKEAAERLTRYGWNRLQEKRGVSPLVLFLDQFKNFIIWVLLGAALVSGFLREWIDALAIFLIVILNSILGFIQEYRAEKSIAALKKLSSPVSKVIRNGRIEMVSSSELVPGDLVELEAGDNVPADSRLVYLTPNFTTQEASLTGESVPVAKTLFALEEKPIPLADRGNMVYMGTSVAAGKARALVVETGMRTELGQIAGMIQQIEKETTPLQKRLEEFGRVIVYITFGLVALIFFLEVWRGGELLNVFLTAVSLAVAAIPEGLPAVVTIALALGVQRMVKRHALIRKLPSVETLGSATVICSDKTGTLTRNEMTVQAVYAGGKLFSVTGVGYTPVGQYLTDGRPVNPAEHPALMQALTCGVLCNGARLVEGKIIGDPTEGAMLTAGAKLDIWKEKIEAEYTFVEEIPFDSERKKMTIIRRRNNKYFIYVKGAPEILLDDCLVNDEEKKKILAVNTQLSDRALRVLGLAYKEADQLPERHAAETVECGLTFLGLMGMIDPPREEVKAAIQLCRAAGIKTVMITGDHKNTAVAIARQLGFFRENSLAYSGAELDQLSDSQLLAKVKDIPVYARVSPENKLRIVQALRQQGEIIAMTGDGVNDAPALKEADIGVAMGITGTDVTKEVSDMVITDDNFSSIVAAVEEGRGIYDNIKKFIHYLLSCNIGEILVMFAASLAGWPIPLLPIQILWVNLVTDGLPALALGVDPVAKDVMRRPPRPLNEKTITPERGWQMLGQGGMIALCSLAAFAFIYFLESGGIEKARTAAFMVLACSQLFHSFNCRSQTESIFSLGWFSNLNLIGANLLSFLLQVAVVTLPITQPLFKTTPLGGWEWLAVVLFSSFPLWAVETIKLAKKHT